MNSTKHTKSSQSLGSLVSSQLFQRNKEYAKVVECDSSSNGSGVHLVKDIGLVHAISIMTGIMIGSGIFVSPVSITYHCGSIGLSLLVWLLSGVVLLLTAASYSELGGMFPQAGGEYAFFRDILGPLPAFLYAWFMFILVNPAFYALLALTTSIYIFQPIFPSCQPPEAATRMFAIWVVVTIVFLNSVYIRYVTRVQTFLAATKFLALIIICITGIVQLSSGKTEVLETGFEGTTSDLGSVAIAMYSGIFTYGGWQYLFALLEEVKNPHRNVPLTTFISFIIIIIIYLLTNVAYFSVMTPEQMMSSNAVAMTFADKTLGSFSAVVPLFVACSTIGALNGSILGGSRTSFAAARDGMLPSVISMISVQYKTPIPSVIATCLLTILYVMTGNAMYLLEYLGFAACLIFVTSVGCVLYLRWKEPERHRPVKVPLWIPIIAFTVLSILTFLGLYKKPMKNGIGVLMGATGIPIYWIFVVWKSKPNCMTRPLDKFWLIVQKILLVVTPEEKTML